MRLAERIQRAWLGPAPLGRLAAFRALVALVALVDLVRTAHAAFGEAKAADAQPSSLAWDPIELALWVGVGPPSPEVVRAVAVLGVVALSSAVLGLFSRSACFAGLLAHTWMNAVAYSFGRVKHDEVALFFALATLPLAPCGAVASLDAWIARARGGPRRAPGERAPLAALPLCVTQLTIAIGYGASGLSKLAFGGVEWLAGWTLMASFASSGEPLGAWLASDLALCRALSWATLAWQLCFPLVLALPRLAWLFVPIAVSFHLVSAFALGTGSYATLWLLLAVFLPFERIAPGLFVRRAGVPLDASDRVEVHAFQDALERGARRRGRARLFGRRGQI